MWAVVDMGCSVRGSVCLRFVACSFRDGRAVGAAWVHVCYSDVPWEADFDSFYVLGGVQCSSYFRAGGALGAVWGQVWKSDVP